MPKNVSSTHKVYKLDESRVVHSVDLQAWIKDGWTLKKEQLEESNKTPAPSTSVKVYKDGQSREISRIDVQAWLNDGWSEDPPIADTEPSEVDTSLDRVNVNTATGVELEKVPGIGRSLSKSIRDNRPFATLDEVVALKSSAKWDEILNYIYVDSDNGTSD